MRHLRLSFVLAVAACSVLFSNAWPTASSASVAAVGTPADNLGAATLQELARARAATAKYHDVAEALADGYIRVSPDIPGEGFHYAKMSLIFDCAFDIEHPETLHYTLFPNGNLQLVGIEYAVPLICLPPNVQPEGFTGDADVWATEEGGPPFWNLNAWIWLDNPNGVFAPLNPRVP